MPKLDCPPEYLAEHYNGRIFRCYYVYVSAKFGAQLFVDACRELGVDADFITADANWFSNNFSQELFRVLREKTGEQYIAENAGRVFGSPEILTQSEFVAMASAPSPGWFLKQLPFHYAKFNRINKLKVRKLAPGLCIFHVSPKKNEKPGIEVCQSTVSMVQGIQSLFDLKNVVVEHTKCIHFGHPICEFKLTYSAAKFWKIKLLRSSFYALIFSSLWFLLTCMIAHPQSKISLMISILLTAIISAVPFLVIGYIRKLKQMAFYLEQVRKTSEELYQARAVNCQQNARVAVAKQVAHDIRSPLAALEVGIMNVSGADSNLVLAAVGRIKDIVNSLLEIDNLERTSSLSFNVESVISPIVQEKKLELKKQDLTNIDISFFNDDVSSCAYADPVKVGRIFSNLLNNAIEAIPNGEGDINITNIIKHGMVQITVKDNGIGIPRENLDLIGYQNLSIGKKEGLGLGLADAKSYLRRIGGKLFITSDVETGTSVSICIPFISSIN